LESDSRFQWTTANDLGAAVVVVVVVVALAHRASVRPTYTACTIGGKGHCVMAAA
jgi:hypothetical protein